MPSELRSWHDS